jgi:hypothetical protein
MNIKEALTINFKCDGKQYEVVIRQVDFVNGYKLVKLIVNNHRCWAIKNDDNWRLMSDYPMSIKLREALLKKVNLRNKPVLRVVHKST